MTDPALLYTSQIAENTYENISIYFDLQNGNIKLHR